MCPQKVNSIKLQVYDQKIFTCCGRVKDKQWALLQVQGTQQCQNMMKTVVVLYEVTQRNNLQVCVLSDSNYINCKSKTLLKLDRVDDTMLFGPP